ncbi:hypothetical protein LAZ67_2005871 [Cordylochernes scorpioides]|uniref:Uncharacterized protein n=1 Tax=Cordylochernes scorpioides TaxID=51811 RepID=A0ABY6K837_9ARAC|nr:hypothetical protein LAZ67_2005871 [Cordylochernes scorpioides]
MEDNWATFVMNRVMEIRSLSETEDWCRVPGCLNPADLPSRGCLADSLERSKWWEGPSWLRRPRRDWPHREIYPDPDIHVCSGDGIIQPGISLTGVEFGDESRFELSPEYSLVKTYLETSRTAGQMSERKQRIQQKKIKPNLKQHSLRSWFSLLHADERQKRETRSWMAFLDLSRNWVGQISRNRLNQCLGDFCSTRWRSAFCKAHVLLVRRNEYTESLSMTSKLLTDSISYMAHYHILVTSIDVNCGVVLKLPGKLPVHVIQSLFNSRRISAIIAVRSGS